MCQSSRALEKRAGENAWVSTWTGKQLVENKGSREPESHGVPWGDGSWSAMMTAREDSRKQRRVARSREDDALYTRSARRGETVVLGDHQTTRK